MITAQEVVQVPYTIQVPYQTTENREQTIATSGEEILSGGHHVPLPSNGISIDSGKTFQLSWSADGNLDAYIFTQTQFNYWKQWGIPSNYEAYSHGKNGLISANIQHSDKYYAVVSNTPILGPSVKLYQAQAILKWQETVTKYRNETQYQTEYVSKEVNSNLYLYSGLVIFGIGVVIPILERQKGKVKKL